MRVLIVCFVILSCSTVSLGQNNSIYTEGVLESRAGLTVNFRNTIYTSDDALAYQETQEIVVDSSGKWWMNIGRGLTTSLSVNDSIFQLDFSDDSVGLRIELDTSGTYLAFSDKNFAAVTNAYYARSTDQEISLNHLNDVDTTGLTSGMSLAYMSPQFVLEKVDSSLYSNVSDVSMFSDTANWVLYYELGTTDSVSMLNFADSASFALNTWNADYADSSSWADSAGFALDGAAWKLYGNNVINSADLGPTNKNDLAIKTNSNTRFLIDSGSVHVGSSGMDTVSFGGSLDGFEVAGPLDQGVYPAYDGNIHFSYLSRKGALISGVHQDTIFSDEHIGYNSFAFGENVYTDADYSIGVGSDISFSNLSKYSFAVGKGHRFEGDSRYGLVSGRNCQIGFARNVAMGDSCSAPYGYACIAMGSNAIAHGNLSPCIAIGTNINNTGRNTHAFGYKIDVNIRMGNFVYADRSTEDTLKLGLVINDYDRWHVRAAGGVGFYTADDLSTGVYLFPGSGSWSSTSSIHSKKIHGRVQKVNSKLSSVPISSWNYRQQSFTHIGPMAQDFFQTFNYGGRNDLISTTDIDGVIMAGIIELSETIEEKMSQINSDSDQILKMDQSLDKKIELLYEKYVK